MAFDLVRRATLAVLTACLAVVAPVVSTIPTAGLGTASADDCPDIEVVFARGTNEAPGLGLVGGAFVDQLRDKVGGRSVGAYAVNYPATYDFLAAANGANDASAHIQYMMGACPNTRLVLGGYSQGAAVIDVIAAVPFPAIGFTNPLPPNTPDFVAGLVAFGNPSAKLGLPLTSSPVWGGRSIDLCNGGDPVCQTNGEDVPAHKAYAGGPTNTAANFVAGLL
ncbi:cutinase family protein [Mycolicibacterium hodleri]|uniref:Cutinase n=1 Tax=Mycolicibacterium hodleri TaxID=49897 RepID=A0A502E9S3_9MYCO|nr:cutinase family protein [Mycolicibacterium hodleri]TPG34393.1 cutinase family protein [Mycolicibacterium hodleri]